MRKIVNQWRQTTVPEVAWLLMVEGFIEDKRLLTCNNMAENPDQNGVRCKLLDNGFCTLND